MGNATAPLRPSFDTKLRGPNGIADFRADILTFRHDETSPASSFEATEGELQGPDAVASFEPWGEGESPTTQRSRADASPGQGGSAFTVRPAAIAERLMQGATPAVARAVALGSATPAPPIPPRSRSSPCPERRAWEWRGRMEAARRRLPARNDRPDYASLIDQDQAGREKKCLAEAIYFEARSEPEEGQAAVAQVVLNRVSSGLYPASVCGVVYQNRHRWHACQFSFACEGKSLRITDQDSWGTASAHCQRGYGRHDLSRRCRQLDPLPCQLRAPALGEAAEEDGRDRPPHLLPPQGRADVTSQSN